MGRGFTEGIKGVDRSFVQVEVDVFGHSERLDLPVLPPVNQPNHVTGSLTSLASLPASPHTPPPLLNISPVSPVGFGNLFPRQGAQLSFGRVFEPEQTGGRERRVRVSAPATERVCVCDIAA